MIDISHSSPQGDPEDDTVDLWFLPGPDIDDESPAFPTGIAPPDQAPLFDPAPWQEAQALLSVELAEVAALSGALSTRLRNGPEGWMHRLALREVANLSWWAGDRLSEDRISLWVLLRLAATGDDTQALSRAAWAIRRLTGPLDPMTNPAGFLELPPEDQRPDDRAGEAAGDLQEILDGGIGLHPIAAASRAFFAWRSIRVSPATDMEAAVIAERVGRGAVHGRLGQAPFLPLAQTGPTALRGQGPIMDRLSLWLRGAEEANLSALLHLDRLERWQIRAEMDTRDLSGRTPPA